MAGTAAPIAEHAVGDGRSAALIDRQGAVSWLAWPRFDSPAACASILGAAILVVAHVVFGAVLGLGATLAR